MNSVKEIVGDWSFMRKIGATRSDKLFVPVPISFLPAVTEKLRDGGSIPLDEVPEEWKRLPIFLDEQSLPFVLYISDQSWFWGAGNYKFHFKWCQTLAMMKNVGKIARYRAKYDICNPNFEINDGKLLKPLKVCINCCNGLRAVYPYFSASKKDIESKFSMPKFFEKFGKIDLPRSIHPGSTDGYTPNWSKLALRLKEEAQWRCQDQNCKNPQKDYSHDRRNLHVHHINGVKSHNVSDNLEVVCCDCHAHKPGHEHMRSSL